ncbi:hypothetical protein SLEP1_g11115 [Rubroshorea leprosula]|uniref:Uncharacterized protein n=1 Tax=Rubroshorea leprosula TaxID=152421 RepID=A0AAV5IAB0_9ROSI|nr:hypothetical protein SLEP1_g11115 [Rubroshorea leprosula]
MKSLYTESGLKGPVKRWTDHGILQVEAISKPTSSGGRRKRFTHQAANGDG